LLAALALVASLLTPAGAAAAEPTPGSLSGQTYAYGDVFAGWPVLPLHQQHPIRGSFLDPRPGEVVNGGAPGYHIGIDVSVRDDRPEKGHPPAGRIACTRSKAAQRRSLGPGLRTL
jgi:hypothetical protein